MSKPQSTTLEPKFVLVYNSSSPKTLHAQTERECWTGHMREATPEELEQLQDARCKHCVSRLAKASQKPAKPAPKAGRQPISRKEPEPAQPAAEPEKVGAPA